MKKKYCFFCFVIFLNVSCGKSIFSSISKNDSTESLKQDAVVLLNQKKYAEATKKLQILWDREKTNYAASLFVTSLAGEAGYPIFSLILNTLKTIGSQKLNNNVGNEVLNAFKQLNFSQQEENIASQQKLKEAIQIVLQAPDKENLAIKFQGCVVGAIYAWPSISKIESYTANLKSQLNSLPTRLSANGAACGASADTINQVSAELSQSIEQATSALLKIEDVSEIIEKCLPSSGSSQINSLTQTIYLMKQNADKGCSIPQNQAINGITLPNCVNQTILNSGGNTAVANDEKLAGCELFLHCTGTTRCF
jgi:hypothetical protein